MAANLDIKVTKQPITVTIKDGAKMMNMDEMKFRKLVHTGEIKAFKDFKKYYVLVSSMQEYAERMAYEQQDVIGL